MGEAGMERLLLVSSGLLWVALLLNLLLTLAVVRRLNTGTAGAKDPLVDDAIQPGEIAPDFVAETVLGEQVTPATYAGRDLALVFVSPQCGPCREALPALDALWPKARGAGVELVLVSNADNAATSAFVAEQGITMPILVAPRDTNPLMANYKVAGTPFYCLIDSRGRVQSTGHPSPNWGEWRALAESWERGTRARVARLAPSEGG